MSDRASATAFAFSWAPNQEGFYSWVIASTFSSSDTSRYRCNAAIDDHPPRSWIAFSRTPALSNRVAQVRRLLWVLKPRNPRRSQAFLSTASHACG